MGEYRKVSFNMDPDQYQLLQARAHFNRRHVGVEISMLLDLALSLQTEEISRVVRLVQMAMKEDAVVPRRE